MRKLLPLVIALSFLSACGEKPPLNSGCPSWKDMTKGHKAQLADEIDAAPASARWVLVLVADQSLKDQLVAAGCKPVN